MSLLDGAFDWMEPKYVKQASSRMDLAPSRMAKATHILSSCFDFDFAFVIKYVNFFSLLLGRHGRSPGSEASGPKAAAGT